MAKRISLAAARVSANLTQAELAQKMGISREYVSAVESGKIDVKPMYLHALCYITGFEVDDIFLPTTITQGED
jgi:putative transcriptional regulator